MRRLWLALLSVALAFPAHALTQAQYLNENGSQSPAAVVLCPSGVTNGSSSICSFVSGSPPTQAQYLNGNNSQSPAIVLLCPDGANPGYTTACSFSGGSGTVTSVSNSDSTLTLSPNPIVGTGTVSLNLGNTNVWTGGIQSTAPTTSNVAQILLNKSGTNISPNNSTIESDCYVSSGHCANVAHQNNQFATDGSVQPFMESWKGECNVGSSWSIADWSACVVATGHSLGIWQTEGADGWNPYTLSVLTCTPTTSGNGYNVGDTITLAGGTLATAEGANDVAGVCTVDTLTGGAGTGVATAHVTTFGGYTVTPGPTGVMQSGTSGSGSGVIFTITSSNHANNSATNIVAEVDPLGTVSPYNIPGKLQFGVHASGNLAPLGMIYPLTVHENGDVSCQAYTGSASRMTWSADGNGSLNTWLDCNTGFATFPSMALSGNISIASPTTNGFGLNGAANPTYTDTTGSGTIAIEAANALPSATIATTQTSVTITNLDLLYLPAPAAGTNVTATNLWSLDTAGGIQDRGSFKAIAGAIISGANINLNASSNFSINLNTGSSTGTTTIGNSSNTGKLVIANMATAVGSDYVCQNGSGVIETDTTCTSSREELKNIHGRIDPKQALAEGLRLKPFWFQYKVHPAKYDMPGFGAHATEKVDRRLVVYDGKGKLASVGYANMVAFQQAEIQALQGEIAALQRSRR